MYSSLHDANLQRNPDLIFSRRRDAHDNGYFQKWELERRGRKPVGPSTAALVDACEATDYEKDVMRGWDLILWIDDETIGHNPRKLYHVDNTKPYRPTEKTQALWKYQDLFVCNWKQWAAEMSDGWMTFGATSYKNGLNHSRVNQHISGQDTFGVIAGRFTNFVSCRIVDQVEKVIAEAPKIQEQLFATKWFCEIDPKGVNVFFVFEGRCKTNRATAHLHKALMEIGVDVPVYPSKSGFRLPLGRGTTCILDRPLQLVTNRNRTEQDVVGLIDWIQNPDSTNLAAAEIVAKWQKVKDVDGSQNETETETTIQTEGTHTGSIIYPGTKSQELQGELKNKCWKSLTGFWLGQCDMPINTAIGITARIFAVEGVNKDKAITIIDNWCDEIPNPTTSRLTDPSKRHLLTKYIQRQVRKLYDGNGGQADVELSTQKLVASVRSWSSKGLILHDKSTWELTYGYMAVPDVEFTEQEQKNIEVYLGPLLSTRDTKNRTRKEVSLQLALAVVKLVATKEREGLAIAIPYWQKYIKGEVGVSCQNKVKFQKIKEALLSLGLMKVIWQGRQGYGATRYGLVGRFAKLLSPDGREGLSVEFEVPANVDEQLAEIVTSYNKDAVTNMVLLSIPVQNANIPVSAPQLNNDWRTTGDPILDKILAETQRKPNNRQAERRRFAMW